ncbi:MAG: hypothetical protein P8M03_05810 [Flavobacteriaceae bacterium]|nr:hypothetical protein [Flavobacteriaceae bacterium]
MEKHFYKTTLILILFFFGCSTQKDNFLNRNYHKLNTKYNVLFNGEEAFQIGKKILEKNKKDNFYKILEVEPIKFDSENLFDTSSIPSFSLAEEKAAKAIQKHSMKINGLQRNNEIHSSYLLLGKSRYFDRRFFPALEAFNFLLDQYSNKKIYNEARLWREKTNLRLRNEDLAISNLKKIYKDFSANRALTSEVNSTLAQAYINLNNKDSALVYIKKASRGGGKLKSFVRHRFIEAQLYESLKIKDSSLLAFNSIVKQKRKAPRPLWIQAKLNAIRLSFEISNKKFFKELNSLSKNVENKIFKHYIFRTQAILLMKKGEDRRALNYYKKSLLSPYIDLDTKKINYRDLANYYYKKNNYIATGKYLDSLISNIESNNLEKKKIVREKKALELVIKYESSIKKNDSILQLTKLSRQKQIDYFKNFIINKMNKKTKPNLEENLKGKNFNNKEFYFYNSTLISLGKKYFINKWGNRPNVDNWKYSDHVKKGNFISEEFVVESDKDLNNYESFERYINKIPKGEKAIDSIRQEINESYLKLGIIYKEKFNNYFLSFQKLEKLLESDPNENQEANALYQLHVLNKEYNKKDYNFYSQKILKKFPKSIYAIKIKDTSNVKNNNTITPKRIYNNFLKLFDNQKYLKIINSAPEMEKYLKATEYASKLKLLISNSIGRLDGYELWKKELESLIEKYPDSDEANFVKKNIRTLSIKDQNRNNFFKRKFSSYKWIFPFNNKDSINENRIKKYFLNYIQSVPNLNWKVSKDVFNRELNLIVIHMNKVNFYKDSLIKNLNNEFDSKVFSKNFVLLNSEYLNMQMHKIYPEK